MLTLPPQVRFPQGFGDICQLGYVVADLAVAQEHWRGFGIGPWTVIRNIRLNAVHRGECSRPLIDIALSYCGALQIELIQQRNDAPSPYRAMIEGHRFGLHHVAFMTPHIADAVRRAGMQGFDVVCDIRMLMSGRYVYLQSPESGADMYVEFLESTALLRGMFRHGMQAAQQWDGLRGDLTLDLAPAAFPASLCRLLGNVLRRSPAPEAGERAGSAPASQTNSRSIT